MNDLELLAKALSYMGCLLPCDERGPIMVTLPPKAWFRVYCEAGKQATINSEVAGCGGVVVQYPPPKGKTFQTGFWFNGAWIEH